MIKTRLPIDQLSMVKGIGANHQALTRNADEYVTKFSYHETIGLGLVVFKSRKPTTVTVRVVEFERAEAAATCNCGALHATVTNVEIIARDANYESRTGGVGYNAIELTGEPLPEPRLEGQVWERSARKVYTDTGSFVPSEVHTTPAIFEKALPRESRAKLPLDVTKLTRILRETDQADHPAIYKRLVANHGRTKAKSAFTAAIERWDRRPFVTKKGES